MPSRSGHPAGYATTLLGSLGGAISVGLLTGGLFSVIERHPLVFGLGNAPDDVFVLLLIGLVGVGIWVGSVLGSVLLLRWRGTGGVAVTAGLLAVLVPSTIVVVLFTERQLLGDRTSALVTVSLFSVQLRPELVWFGVAWGAVLLLPTLLARALQQLVATRRSGRPHSG